MTIKSSIRNYVNNVLLSKLGVELVRHNSHIEKPWLGPEFKSICNRIQQDTLLDPQRLWVLSQCARTAIILKGDMAEFGTWRGGSTVLLAHIIHNYNINKCIHAFDSFKGFPEPNRNEFHKRGELSDTSIEHLSDLLSQVGVSFAVHPGYFSDTLPIVANNNWCFIHIDADLYSSIFEVLETTWDNVSQGGLVLVDDYGFRGEPGAKKAVNEFSTLRRIYPIHLPTGQALLIKPNNM